MRWFKQIGLLMLVTMVACRPSSQPTSNQQVEMSDSIKVCTISDTSALVMGSKLPSLFINLDENDKALIYKDKSQWVYASIMLFLPDGTIEYEGDISIKTRGNSSWKAREKKPFTIKFSQSERLLGKEKEKSFVLLNNLMDASFIRNAMAFHLSNTLGIFAPDFTFITLYLNGDYLGIYQMTNQIKVSKRSVDIVDLEKENKRVNNQPLREYPAFSNKELWMVGYKRGVCIANPEDITGGYLLDYNGSHDSYKNEISFFVSNAGDPIRIKSPKHASPEQVAYIANFYDQLEAAVMDPSGRHPVSGKHYSEYIDIESFARYFLLQEITQNLDGGWCSFFMHKDIGDSSKMVAGPAWDFDRAMQRLENPKYSFNRLWTVSKNTLKKYPNSGGLLYWLWQHEDFRNLAKSIYLEELYIYLIDSIQWQTYADSLSVLLCDEFKREQTRFPTDQTTTYQECTNEVINFLKERNDFLYWLWTADKNDIVSIHIMGYYDPNRNDLEKDLILYGNKTDGVMLPKFIWNPVSYRDPRLLGYFLYGTDTKLEEGTRLYSDQCVEIRWKYPNWCEAQYRRICNKLKRMFHKKE